MLSVPRERFAPPAQASVAYLDRDIAIDRERAMLKPMLVARMIQAADIGAADHVLDVAAASGYTPAVLAQPGAAGVALEDDAARAGRCGEILAGLGVGNAKTVCGPLAAGWPALGPYDAILIEGACEVEPHDLFAQLKEGGRLVGIFGTGPAGKAMIYRKDRGEVGARPLFDAAAPALPAFARAPSFVF